MVVRRGRTLIISEVKARTGTDHGDPLEAVGPEKARRVRQAAEAWLASRPELAGLDVRFEAVAVRRASCAPTPVQAVPRDPMRNCAGPDDAPDAAPARTFARDT